MTRFAPSPELSYAESIRRIARTGRDSLRDYRQLIEAMARPGTIAAIGTVQSIPPVITLAAGLADVDVTVAVLDEDWERPFLVSTGARPAPAGCAEHVIATAALTVAELAVLERGDALHPERGARVFAAVRNLGERGDVAAPADTAVRLTLSGPGIVGETELAVDGLASDLFEALSVANLDFPAGIDLILVAADGRIAAIPRSTRIQTGHRPHRES